MVDLTLAFTVTKGKQTLSVQIEPSMIAIRLWICNSFSCTLHCPAPERGRTEDKDSCDAPAGAFEALLRCASLNIRSTGSRSAC